MPPPETKSISFAKPTSLALSNAAIEIDKAMIPTQLRTLLKDISGDGIVGMVLLPQFGYLYVATDNLLLDYELNLLDNKNRPFQIQNVAGKIQIAPKGQGTPVLFHFGDQGDESITHAKKVAKDMESLLGYPIQEA